MVHIEKKKILEDEVSKKVFSKIVSGMCVRIINKRGWKSKIFIRQINDLIKGVRLKTWSDHSLQKSRRKLKAEDYTKKERGFSFCLGYGFFCCVKAFKFN